MQTATIVLFTKLNFTSNFNVLGPIFLLYHFLCISDKKHYHKVVMIVYSNLSKSY